MFHDRFLHKLQLFSFFTDMCLCFLDGVPLLYRMCFYLNRLVLHNFTDTCFLDGIPLFYQHVLLFEATRTLSS